MFLICLHHVTVFILWLHCNVIAVVDGMNNGVHKCKLLYWLLQR